MSKGGDPLTGRLIERWLPIAAIGVESVRERTPMTPFPAPNRLHVWWARRPLVASRAAILASLLPADADHEKFLHMIGIHGDPVAAKSAMDAARRSGTRIDNPYTYGRAFGYLPKDAEKRWLREQLGAIGLSDAPLVLDPAAGGGSIPFESARLGLATVANDLNPVASLILRATVEWPVAFGLFVATRFELLAREWRKRVESGLADLFPRSAESHAVDTTYLWARTITCPYCDGLIPLSPNWRLAPDGTGVRLRPDSRTKRCSFEIVRSAEEHSEGTVKGGDARCPFPDCEKVIDGDEVKRQAQAGQMGERLFAIVFKERVETKTKTGRVREAWQRGYRAPVASDDNAEEIRRRLEEKLPEWEVLDYVPSELIGELSNYDRGHRMYGMRLWRDLFSPRQLLCHGTSVEVFVELLEEAKTAGSLDEVTKAAFGYLALSLDKMRDYNSRMTRWHSIREVVVNTFDSHNFAMRWSYVEMAPLIVGLGFDWAIDQTAKCIKELIALVGHAGSTPAAFPAQGQLSLNTAAGSGTAGWGRRQLALGEAAVSAPPSVTITCRSADHLEHVSDASVDCVVMDPPYYDNVMYAELSDFFYVWLKRTAGRVFPELFRTRLTDKEQEAVANPAKFKGKDHPKERADLDYRRRMAAIFAECRRVLRPDGVLTLMFTHKATGAWDALAAGLIEAGFAITASWPINTEAEGSLHIKEKSAANSTIFLVCRPRPPRPQEEVAYWEDVEPRVAQAVRARIEEFQQAGIRGVDLYLSCFGPALEEFARHWPLRRGAPKIVPEQRKPRQRRLFADEADPYAVTPEDALDAARREVKKWRLDRLLRTTRHADLDPLTEWFVLAWDAFRAPEFPYDEALRLARVVGVDLDRDVIQRVAEKKGSDVVLLDSARRVAKGALGPADGSTALLDALHHAAYRARKDGLEAGRRLLEESGATQQPAFPLALTALLEVLPVSSTFTKIAAEKGAVAEAASDFDALEHLRRLAFSDRVPEPEQLSLWTEGPPG